MSRDACQLAVRKNVAALNHNTNVRLSDLSDVGFLPLQITGWFFLIFIAVPFKRVSKGRTTTVSTSTTYSPAIGGYWNNSGKNAPLLVNDSRSLR